MNFVEHLIEGIVKLDAENKQLRELVKAALVTPGIGSIREAQYIDDMVNAGEWQLLRGMLNDVLSSEATE